MELELKNPNYCDECGYLHTYRCIIYARCRKSFRNNYIHENTEGNHWIRPKRCIEENISIEILKNA